MNVTTHDNPNEAFGVRACSFANQQKHADCGGDWYVAAPQSVRVANPLAPYLTVCENHLREAVTAFKTPTVKEVKPKRVTELSL
jgi:hypothetical protein